MNGAIWEKRLWIEGGLGVGRMSVWVGCAGESLASQLMQWTNWLIRTLSKDVDTMKEVEGGGRHLVGSARPFNCLTIK